MAIKPVKIELGAFAAGEIPPPLVHAYTDFDGNVVDLTGFITLAFNVEATPAVTGPLGDGAIAFFATDPTLGKVEYTWSSTDMAEPATYLAQMWVYNGSTGRYASDTFVYLVYDGPGEYPI